MRSLFTAALNRPLNTLIDSDTITLSGIGTGVPFTLLSGAGTSAYKNGANVTSTTVSDGDRIRIRVRSSTAYATPTFGAVKIGSEETIFSVVTLVDSTPIAIESMSNVLPFDLAQYSDGQEYVPSDANNSISVYTNGALSKTVPLTAPATNSPRITDGTLIANYHSDQLFFLNSNLDVAAAIDLPEGSKPYGFAVTATSSSDDVSLTWVTLSGLNKVVALDASYQIVAEYPTGVRPLGIATSADGAHVYVANYGSNTITHFTYANEQWTGISIAVGSKPFEIAIDAANNAWVSHVGEDKVYRVSSANVATAFTLASSALRGIAVDTSGAIWVAASKSNAIVKLNSDGTVAATIPTGKHPYAVSIAVDGAIDVSCFADSRIQSYSANDGTMIRDHATAKFPYGVSTFGAFSVVANLYSNTPDYIIAKDQAATQFALADVTRIPKAGVYTTNSFRVSGITVDTSVVAAVPGDVFGAKLIKNGNAVGPNTTVVNGDMLALQFTAPNSFDTFVEIPLYIGNTFDLFTSRTEIEGVTPELFTFTNVLSANLNELYTSNTITIAGLSTGTTVPFSVDAGKIVLNGVEQASQSIDVKNGDTIALRATSPVTEKSSLYITTLTGRIMTRADGTTTQQNKNVWRITTKAVTNEVWVLPAFKGKSEYEPAFTASTSVTGKYLTRIDNANAKALYAISNTPRPYDGSILIPSYHDGAVYQLNASENSFNPIEDLNLAKRPVDVAANRYVAYTGTSNLIVDLVNAVEITLPAIPRKIAVGATNDILYVSLSDGTMAVIVRENGITRIREVVQVGGSPYALAVTETGIWISDLESKAIHFYRVDDLQLSQTFFGGGGAWDMCATNTHLWIANSYDNTVSKINIASGQNDTIKVESVPNHIEIDSGGNICVSHYASKTVIRLNPTTNARLSTTTLDYAPPAYMRREDEFLYIAEFHATQIETQRKVGALTPLVLSFEPQIDELINSRVQSARKQVAGLIRPTRISIEPDNNYDLYVNGVKSVTGSEVVDVGDEVYLDVLASNLYYTERVVTVSDFQTAIEFRVRTETNIKPEAVVFADLFDAIPGETVESNEVTIKGMTPGHTTSLRVSRAGWKVSINGAVPVENAVVKNDDVIKLVGPVRGSYNTFTTYKLYAGKFDYELSTFVVHNKDLDGPSMYFLDVKNSIPTFWTSRTHRSVYEVDSIIEAEKNSNNYRYADTPDLPEFELRRRYRIQELVFEKEPQLERRYRIQGLVFEKEPELRRHERIQNLLFDKQVELRARNELYFSGVKEFEQRPSSNQYTPPAPEVEKGISVRPYEFDAAVPLKISRLVVDAELRTNTLIPSLFSRAIRFRETATAEYQKHTSIAPRLAPALEYDKRIPISIKYVDVKVFETNPRRLHKFVVPQYQVRENRAFQEIERVYERREYREWFYHEAEYERNIHYPQRTFNATPILRERSNVYFSPESEYRWIARHTPLISEVQEFVALSVGKGIEADFKTFDRMPSSLLYVDMPQAVRLEAKTFTHLMSTAERLPNSMHVSEPTKFEKLSLNYWVIDKPIDKRSYAIHDYTFEETAEIEGAYASAAEAIAAGKAAGHDGAYPVMIGKNRFMWAVAIDSGDFCGVVAGPSLYPIPEKWYVHGG